MQNFEPENLTKKMNVLFDISISVEHRLHDIEAVIEELRPYLALLQKQNAGEIAGQGATMNKALLGADVGTYSQQNNFAPQTAKYIPKE